MALEGWLLLLVVAFLLGYIAGHRQGKVEGFREGVVFAPIEMRRTTLERGRCMICGTGARRQRDAERVSRNEPASFEDDRTPASSDE
ncbi:MAG: hypothetical protein GX795_12470 [Firmicutes bacterium]|jgi:hypothetical protein|nr:hypothetical protein [Bacillota bacterium]